MLKVDSETKDKIETGLAFALKQLAADLNLNDTDEAVLRDLLLKVQCYGLIDILGVTKTHGATMAKNYLEKCPEFFLTIRNTVKTTLEN